MLRVSAVCALTAYCGLLLTAALPGELFPNSVVSSLGRAAGYCLHTVGIASGLEVFRGRTAPHAIPHMNCFRITALGDGKQVLYDDLALCRARRIEPVRDPFRIFQMRNLSETFVHLNLGGRGALTQDPLRAVFLFGNYYCHTEQARAVKVQRLQIESLYVGYSVADGTTGEVNTRGNFQCNTAPYAVD